MVRHESDPEITGIGIGDSESLKVVQGSGALRRIGDFTFQL